MLPDRDGLARLTGEPKTALEITPLHGDGSTRRFFRIAGGSRRWVLLVGPDPAENAAYVRVARHLAARRVRVPRIHGTDEVRGWILLEDLGDRSLCAALGELRTRDEVPGLYAPVIDLLCVMQVLGSEGFGLTVGFAPAPYGRELMVEWEGMYFAREFAMGVLGVAPSPGYSRELELLAAEASRAPGGYFLHRDFQSRNIQMAADGPCLIDFQGARPGPLAYDAAALILDPYAGHPVEVRESLFRSYLKRLGEYPDVDPETVQRSWFSLGTFRLLQALGAFGKLGGRLGKTGFLEHAAKALDTLLEHLGDRGEAEYPELWRLVSQCRERWGARSGA